MFSQTVFFGLVICLFVVLFKTRKYLIKFSPRTRFFITLGATLAMAVLLITEYPWQARWAAIGLAAVCAYGLHRDWRAWKRPKDINAGDLNVASG